MCVIAVSKLDFIRNYAEKQYKYTKIMLWDDREERQERQRPAGA